MAAEASPAAAATEEMSSPSNTTVDAAGSAPDRIALPPSISQAAKARLSHYSATSLLSRSRPVSHVLSMFPSSLPYALVRDFAYPTSHPLHFGPLPEPPGPPSGMTTPLSESRRLSDPPAAWEQKMPWDSWTNDGFYRGHDIPPIQFGDGPPYSEDEDLQSPVVATRHRKHKSTSAALGKQSYDAERGYYVGTGGDGSDLYYMGHGVEANGPGGDLVTYPPDDARHSRAYHYSHQAKHGGSGYMDDGSPPSSPGFHGDQSRYSRDYQFTITSPDEEFHGKAVALFDFARENENELPLVEGQIIWVSYRHGQGWLVAEDPKTEESGLVPEEYVRLIREIEGGMNSLTGQLNDGSGSPNEAGTPTQPEHNPSVPKEGNPSNGYHQPVVSVFSTSSKDLNPYPTDQLGREAGQAPPQVVHYHGQRGGSQANTPTLTQSQDSEMFLRRESLDTATQAEGRQSPTQEQLASRPEATEVTATEG